MIFTILSLDTLCAICRTVVCEVFWCSSKWYTADDVADKREIYLSNNPSSWKWERHSGWTTFPTSRVEETRVFAFLQLANCDREDYGYVSYDYFIRWLVEDSEGAQKFCLMNKDLY